MIYNQTSELSPSLSSNTSSIGNADINVANINVANILQANISGGIINNVTLGNDIIADITSLTTPEANITNLSVNNVNAENIVAPAATIAKFNGNPSFDVINLIEVDAEDAVFTSRLTTPAAIISSLTTQNIANDSEITTSVLHCGTAGYFDTQLNAENATINYGHIPTLTTDTATADSINVTDLKVLHTIEGSINTTYNLSGGDINTIPIQIQNSKTSFLPAGSVGQLLQSNGTEHTPTWMNPTGLAATNAVNIAGGDSGQLLYQSNVNETSKLLIGAANSVLVSDGANPTWASKAPAAVEADHAAAATLADNSTLAVTLTGNVSNTAVKGTLPIGADVVVYYTSGHPDTTYGGSWILKDII